MGDNLKLTKRKREWRDREYKDCIVKPIEDGQKFVGGKKVILWYPSNRTTGEDGYFDAEWSQRIEVHHILDDGCHTFFTERSHDAINLSEAWNNRTFIRNSTPLIHSIRIQRDGATQLLTYSDFSFHDYQAIELRGIN